ncbi:MAG TPA: FAD-dependent monooxygenase [Anaerolineales bacterium]|nr:FAD-dependent monooxygenase [Anaerolineales bacterium]
MAIKEAVIIGGGIGGLCTAIALQQHGFEVHVYEQVKKFGEVGAGLTLWSNAIKALRTLGVADGVISAGSKVTRSHIRTASGDMLHNARMGEMETQYGEPVVAIHRAALHEILISALKPNTLRLGIGFTEFRQDANKVTVHFDNGKTDSADLLIGADGIHSAVRRQMFPEIQLRYSGYTAWRGVVETENEAALGLTSESWGIGARFGIVRVDRSHIYWFATSNQPTGERSTGEQRKEKLLSLFRDWHDPIHSLLDSTPAGAILQNDIHDIPPFASWSQGRVTLLGDSAHATTPNMGQGACMAIESAYVLGRSLKEAADYRSALRRYEGERHARTAWITNTSWTIGKGGQIGNPLLCKLRNLLVKVAPAGAMQKNIQQAAGFDVLRAVCQ